MGLGADLDGQRTSRPIGIRFPDRPARSEKPICNFDRHFILTLINSKLIAFCTSSSADRYLHFIATVATRAVLPVDIPANKGKLCFFNDNFKSYNFDTEREV